MAFEFRIFALPFLIEAAFPAHGETADAILQAADLAMYSAKSRGGNEVVSYKVRKKIKRPAASKRTSR